MKCFFSPISLVLAFLLMLSNYLLLVCGVQTIFNSCTCISMGCHTAIVITLQRWLRYLLHVCLISYLSPDFARRCCPELNIKVQVGQQENVKKKRDSTNPFYTGLSKNSICSFAPLVYSSLPLSTCPLKHVCSPLLWSPHGQSPDTVSWSCTFQN